MCVSKIKEYVFITRNNGKKRKKSKKEILFIDDVKSIAIPVCLPSQRFRVRMFSFPFHWTSKIKTLISQKI
jgi:hypothetical protein